MKLSEIYQNARHLIETKGWCQSELHNDSGAHCAAGALMAVTDGIGVLGGPNYQSSRDFLSFYTEAGWILSLWNDNPLRTKEDVLELFDIATSLALSEGL